MIKDVKTRGMVVLVAVVIGAVTFFLPAQAAETVLDDYVLEWNDEFDGATLDTNRWNRCERGNSDWNRHMSLRPDLVEVKDGALVLWGVSNTDTNADPRPFLTGGVQSKGKGLMGIGKVEIRVKFEDHQKGAWPALWMCGEQPDAQGRRWPWNGEIDIVERLNGDSFVYHTVHSGWTFVKKHTKNPPHGGVKAAIRQGDWNVYGLEVTEKELVWSVNGKETFRYPKTDCGDPDQWPFDKPFYFLLDMQLSGKWVGEVDISTLPVRMYIDWIRVYGRPCKAEQKFQTDRSVMNEAYWKLWNDKVQAKIDADIEKHRKADATVEVAASDGAEVKIEQLTHAFHFGASIFNFNQLGSKERNARYKALWPRLFNSATVPFYWKTLEPRAGSPRYYVAKEDSEEFWNICSSPEAQPHWRRPPPGDIIDYLRPLGVRIHGHVLVWANFYQNPAWLWFDGCPDGEKRALEEASGVKFPRSGEQECLSPKEQKKFTNRLLDAAWGKVFDKMSEEEIAALVPTYFKNLEKYYESHVRDIAQRFGDRVDSWDVVNESAAVFKKLGEKSLRGKPFDKARYGADGVCGQPMPADYALKAFKWAQESLPERAVLSINDWNKSATYVKQIEDLRAHGARVGMIGAQMHLMNPKASTEIEKNVSRRPDVIAKRCRLLSQPGLPIHCSEITVTAPDRTKRGEMIQAIILRNFYRMWFSVEKMDGITWWNLVDDCGLSGEPVLSGIFTRDMQPKAAYFALNDLINREWKTRTTAKAANGKVAFRGFRGRYRLTWKGADGKIQTKTAEVK